MIIPVRCFSCGKVSRILLLGSVLFADARSIQVVGDLWERYLEQLDQGVPDG